MKRNIIILFLSCMLFACTSSNNIPYTEAANYFVRNDAGDNIPVKIENEVTFNSYFGMAAVMGENGMPTNIDFTKQFVIAITLPETDIDTEITPVGLQKADNNKITYTYEVKHGEKRSYTTRPMSIIIVDKKYNGDISLIQK